MIPPPVARAIVEILTTAEESIGTGSVVSGDGLILTARHVGNGSPVLKVRFYDGSTVGAALLEEGKTPADDWALYRVDSVPAGIDPMPRGELGNVATQVSWHSIGFAKIRGNTRGGFHGDVRSAAPNLELYCEEFVNRSYDDARGLSGGPCIVDGEAVALIVNVLYDVNSGQIVTGQVHAIPLDQIQPQTVQLKLGGEPRLPWEYVISGSLQDLSPDNQRIAALAAGLANPIAGPRLPRQIARRMINGGVLSVAAVLRQLKKRLRPEIIDEIFILAETLWVDGMAAESMNARVRVDKCGALATGSDWSAQHHLHRAFTIGEAGPRPWEHILIDILHQEPFAQAILKETFETLAEKFGRSPNDEAKIKATVRTLPPIAAFIVSPPREDVAKALREPFPNLVIIFLSRSRPSGSAPFVKSIDPAPTEAEEQDAAEQNRDARLLLTM